MSAVPAQYVLPTVNALLAVDVDVYRELASRVEDVEQDSGGPVLVVAAPRYPGSVDAPPAGAALTLRWTSERGRLQVPAALVGVRRLPHACWQVRPGATVGVDQRRRFTRAGVDGPATVCALDLSDRGVAGQLVDVGEGGARIRLAYAPALEPGSPVMLRFALDDDLLAVPAIVVRTLPEQPGVQVSLAFGDLGRDADRIRRHVLRRQILARKAQR